MSVVPRLAMRGVRKAFGATQALGGVDLEVAPGEIHALLGENGAGKSTLMKVLAGVHAPDAGTIELDGRPFAPRTPLEARALGVAMIHQELALCPHLGVCENVFLGREDALGGRGRRARMAERTRTVLSRLGLPDLDPWTPTGTLPLGVRQIVEIARALAFAARIVVMDEPTSSLGPAEVARLFAVARDLAASGTAVVLISHSFREVRAVASRCTVLRDGVTVLATDLAHVDDAALVLAMAGRGLATVATAPRPAPGGIALAISGLAGRVLPRTATLEVRHGEVVGIFGMAGAGRSELLRALVGLAPVRAGTITVGTRTDHGAPAEVRWRERVGFVSEDRKGEGLALGLSVAENLTLTNLAAYAEHGFVSLPRRDAAARSWMTRLAVKAASERQCIRELSGGNQQKVALLRLLHHGCEVLVLDEPTRGIDVAGRAAIGQLVLEQRAAGKAILLVSGAIPELLELCDRIAVLRKGVLGPARPVAEWHESSLLAEAAGGDA